jgi:hypothetical protein
LLASSIAANSDAFCNGFERTAMTPADSERSRTLISLCAVMMMVGILIPLRVQMLVKLEAGHLRHLQVDDQAFGEPAG